MSEIDELLAAALDCEARGERYVLATVVAVRGSSYRRPGARLLVPENAEAVGIISGGCLEAEAARLARSALTENRARLVSIDHSAEGDEIWGSGLGCRGAIDLLVEPPSMSAETVGALRLARDERRATVLHTPFDGSARRRADGWTTDGRPMVGEDGVTDPIVPPLHLVVFGAGPDAPALVGAAQRLGWQVTVLDWRRGLLDDARFPDATLHHVQPSDAAASVAGDARTAVVLMSHDYLRDSEALGGFAGADVTYLGVLGPRERTERMLVELGAGTSLATDPRFHAPAGLDIGADGPEEVAASIIAEIVAVMHGRSGGPLSESSGPIHAPTQPPM